MFTNENKPVCKLHMTDSALQKQILESFPVDTRRYMTVDENGLPIQSWNQTTEYAVDCGSMRPHTTGQNP